MQETFQHSGDTISQITHDVADVVVWYKMHVMNLPASETPPEIETTANTTHTLKIALAI